MTIQTFQMYRKRRLHQGLLMWPQRPYLHAALMSLPGATVPSLPLCHCSASHTLLQHLHALWARSLQGHFPLLLSEGSVLPCVHLQVVACHLCGGLDWQMHCSSRPFPTLRYASDPAQVTWSHSCCRCRLGQLTSGPAFWPRLQILLTGMAGCCPCYAESGAQHSAEV